MARTDQEHLDIAHWHAPRPWRVVRLRRLHARVTDADGVPVTATICIADAEAIVELGNRTDHHHGTGRDGETP